ncbi:MAG TPA: hypothetical protein VMW18_02530 [Candidatus Binatia bacterium]|nr:hypothetical protein [Candidatus Binatia bacterium]
MTSTTKRVLLLVTVLGMTGSFAAGYAIAAQPHMQNALHALRNAKGELEVALADKAGHRVKAIDLVNQAIGEVEVGIAAGQ